MSIFLNPLQLIVHVLANGLVIAFVLLGDGNVLAQLLDDRMCFMHLALMLVLKHVKLAGRLNEMAVFDFQLPLQPIDLVLQLRLSCSDESFI